MGRLKALTSPLGQTSVVLCHPIEVVRGVLYILAFQSRTFEGLVCLNMGVWSHHTVVILFFFFFSFSSFLLFLELLCDPATPLSAVEIKPD